MKKRSLKYLVALLAVSMLVGCGQAGDIKEVQDEVISDAVEAVEDLADAVEENEEASEELAEVATDIAEVAGAECPLEDGTYVAEFDSDSSMFHINEANDGKGILTVKDGVMTMHISLPSKSVVNLFPGLVEDATKDGAVLLEPTIDTVTYSDGTSEEVHGFDIPVPVIGEEFDLALIGTKGKWYDHKVVVSNPVAGDDIHGATSDAEQTEALEAVEDGEYLVEITMEGGSGKASIESPAKMVVKNGESVVTITWSSPNYDYMLLDGVKYEPVNTEGNSIFELPIKEFGVPVTVIGDTTAMSKPHEVEYKITCNIQ